jgi:hypothetical protein
MKKTQLILTAAIALFAATFVNAQTIPFPQPSPAATVSQNFATSKIEISYARPSARGRKVFGDVVPFGKFWRTGANAATTISFGEDVKVNGQDVKAGKYGIITFPGENEWTIVLTKDLNVTSEDAYKKENDVARFQVKPAATASFIETFTIEVSNMKNDACDIEIKWERTVVTLKVAANYDDRLMKQIGEVMNKDTRPYYGAANYYFENGKDLNQALVWVNKAVEANPKAYWVLLLKAKIQRGLKDYDGAITTATQSMEIAKADNNDTYVKNNERLIAEIKALPDYKPAPAKKKK